MEATAVSQPAGRRRGRRRSVLAGISLILACLVIALATVSIWVHQVALNTDRFTALVTDVVGDPQVIAPVSQRVSQQVVDALDVQDRIAGRLPDAAKPIAPALTDAVRDAIDKRLQQLLQNPRVQSILLRSISITHERLVALLRGDTTNVTITDGYLVLNAFPVVGAALTELQSMGLIPADVTLPDLTADEAPAALAARLQSALGVTLPPDFGTIRLVQADSLVTAQTAIKAFDLVVIVLIILAIVLAGLALWLSRDRRRMAIYLTIGTVVALALARVAIRGGETLAVSAIGDKDLATAVRDVLDTMVADLVGLTTIVLVGAAVLGIVVYLSGRPAWLRRLSERSRATSRGVAGAAGATAASASRVDLAPIVRENRSTIEKAGIAAIAFSLVWLAVGFEIALLGAILVGSWIGIVHLFSDSPTAGDEGV
jgi:hypothetical protein